VGEIANPKSALDHPPAGRPAQGVRHPGHRVGVGAPQRLIALPLRIHALGLGKKPGSTLAGTDRDEEGGEWPGKKAAGKR